MVAAKILVGLVGFGTGSSVFHAPLITSSGQFELTHVLERSSSKSQALSPAPTIVRSMDELLATDVQLVVISTPTTVHFEQAKAAMQAKRHVVVDKPLCVTAQQAQELCAVAQANGVLFSVFQNRRFDSDFLTVRGLMEDGTLGQVQRFEAHYDRYRPTMKGYWKEKAGLCGGVLYDLGAHVTDQALQLFGKPDAVDADVQIQREGAENDDFFRLEFKYNQFPEREVILSAGMLVKDLGPKYTVVGSKGTFVKYGEDGQEDALRAGKRPGDEGWGQEPESSFGKFTDAVTGETRVIPTKLGSYQVYYTNIAAAIRGEEKLLVDPEGVVEQIRILEDAKKTERVNRISV
ncbi:scyllo-inositol 2-dehydrogenase (NADP(+)) IolW [Phytophthora ramorum]|uniref:scyllo-inositol 2-dehydrogenase (NADP(+)) IolW n=1 Tax=Phytophthora ramorum TaxID=164328 RepID=UPI003096B645|nr:scyllo-inositol 2-dehydrogenase (NADP(+)) IolW [Phytophthora ramorum]